MKKKYDAIIIGAGIIGSAISFELSKKGWRTLNIDKNPSAGYGSTSTSCAIIRVYYSTFEGCAMAYEGYHYWKDWENYLSEINKSNLSKFIECGCMIYKTEQNDFLKKITKLSDQLSIPYEIWDNKKIKSMLPIADTHEFSPVKPINDDRFGFHNEKFLNGSIYFPNGGYVNDPQLATHNLKMASEKKGGEFLFNSEVVDIIKTNGRASGIILSDGTELFSKCVVNVAGPHSMKINKLAGVDKLNNIKTKALKVEVCHVPSPENFNFEKEGFVISDSDIGCYSRPEHGNNILIGGEEPDCDEKIFVDPDDWDKNFSEQWKAQVLRQGQRYPDLPISSKVKGVVDLYDVSDDWIPIYDKSDLPGYYMAIGTSGNQFKNAPVAGLLMSDLIEYCENGKDHDKTPLLMNLKNINKEINLGFFSRNRKINTDSSMSVLG
mgnify:CR=1 FL=1